MRIETAVKALEASGLPVTPTPSPGSRSDTEPRPSCSTVAFSASSTCLAPVLVDTLMFRPLIVSIVPATVFWLAAARAAGVGAAAGGTVGAAVGTGGCAAVHPASSTSSATLERVLIIMYLTL